MKGQMPARAYRMGEMGNDPRILGVSIFVSMVCHLILFGLLVIQPGYSSRRIFSPPVINVSIITLPEPDVSNKSKEATGEKKETSVRIKADPVPPAPEAAATDREKSDTKAVSIVPQKFKTKTSLKNKTFKSSKVLKRAISEIEKKVDASRADPVVKAIDRLRKTVDKSDRVDTRDEAATERANARDRQVLEVMDIYKAEIPYRIQKNWVFSEQLAGGRTDLVAWLVIEIMPDGEIRNIWFEKRSGNRYFDDQAYKAVKKSDPLPSLPEGYKRPIFNVGLRFTPFGLR
jgi:colicin import membrane protein